MSTQPEHDDLDRTDELPQLDVAAYEARLREEDPLSSTDTWLVASLQESEDDRELDAARRSRGRAAAPASVGVDLSIIDRLEQRISSLESELSEANASRVEWNRQRQAWSTERTGFEKSIVVFQAERERLEEQQGISRELVQRLQRQLQELGENQQALQEQTRSERQSERAEFERRLHATQQQVDARAAELASTQGRFTTLQSELVDATAATSAREREIEELQRNLVAERGKADTLARNFAAKLADYEIMSTLVTQRNTTIAALEGDRKNLDEQLSRAQAHIDALDRKVEQLTLRAQEADRYASELGQRDGELTKVGGDLERTSRELQSAHAARTDAERSAQETHARLKSIEEQLEKTQRDLATSREARQALTAECEALLPLRKEVEQRTSELNVLMTELMELRSTRTSLQQQVDESRPWKEQLTRRDDEFKVVSAELVSSHAQLASLKSQLDAQTALAQSQRQDLAIAQQALADLHAQRTQVQASLDESLRNIERLHAVSKDDTDLLNERNAQLQAARAELGAQTEKLRGLEHSLSARDQLIENMRGEIRTTQEERAIVAEQLNKSRARVKSMSQELFARDNRIAVLKADLAVHTEALAAIRRDVDRIESPSAGQPEPLERVLEPVDHDGDPILLNRRVLTIGRTNDNDIFIPSKMISRHHARLLVGPNAVIVEDAGSTNGCFVNDQQVKQHVLREGDVLAIGDLKFRLGVRNRDGSVRRDNVVDFDPDRHLDS